ncbi:MAG: hypothetical protein ACI87W_002339 [Halieaceae bacterium]|jgi:hypothetical protein
MFIDEEGKAEARVSTRTALRHVLVFQLKLTADALRDFLLSPLSLLAFGIDVLRKPKVEDSLYLRLMLLGRRSDQVINLFDEHRDNGAFTIDRAIDELEILMRKSRGTAGEGGNSEDPDGEGDSSTGEPARADSAGRRSASSKDDQAPK